jgi:excisionase family DNA binding protein
VQDELSIFKGQETDMEARVWTLGSKHEATEMRMATSDDLDAPEALLTPSEVAQLFRVNPKTVTRWARAGKLTAIRTLGGHRRFRASEIKRCLEEMSVEER